MDIRNWGIDRVMQLPDSLFGSRWPISLKAVLSDANPVFDISEAALPEITVLWELNIKTRATFGNGIYLSLALGDVLPTTDAQFDACELLLPHMIDGVGRRSSMWVPSLDGVELTMIRQPIRAMGRRLIARFIRVATASTSSQCNIIISSVPKEIPDWLLSV